MIVFLYWIDQRGAPLSMRSSSLVPATGVPCRQATLADRRHLDALSFWQCRITYDLRSMLECGSRLGLVLSTAAAVGQQQQHCWELFSLVAALSAAFLALYW
mgnify:CR=1 FL=1